MEAQIVLGDRPVEVTLQRAWEALSLRERFDLGRVLLGLAFQRAGIGGGSGKGGRNAAEEVYRGRSAWMFSRRVGCTWTVCSVVVVSRRELVICGKTMWVARSMQQRVELQARSGPNPAAAVFAAIVLVIIGVAVGFFSMSLLITLRPPSNRDGGLQQTRECSRL